MKATLLHRASAATLALLATASLAQFDPGKVLREPAAVAQHFPDPHVRYATPGFREGRGDFASHAEVLSFLEDLARQSPHVKVEMIGRSQLGRPIPLVVFSSDPALPTVLIIAQQHGNEPSSGEAALAVAQLLAGPRAALLERVNVLIVPRANPDGAERFARATASGIDVNRDHLLLQTPEARALAAATLKYRPQVVLDLHEFTVGGRWVEKFGAMMRYDALLQPATVGNLDPGIAAAAQLQYVERTHAALAAQGMVSFHYYTTSNDAQDRTVSMGGVQPDTGRNVAGLRHAISILLEARGVGLGRAHFLRRVHTQVIAATTMIETAAEQGRGLVALVRQAEAAAGAQACRGELVVAARHSETRQRLMFLDAVSGAELPIEVDWRAAAPLQVVRQRARPCGYLLSPTAQDALARLRLLGVRIHPVAQAARWEVERYVVTAQDEAQRQDARGAIEDAQPIRVLQVRTEPANEVVAPGTLYIALDQPLAPLIAAALEPDSQNSYAANRLLDLDASRLRRVMKKPPLD